MERIYFNPEKDGFYGVYYPCAEETNKALNKCYSGKVWANKQKLSIHARLRRDSSCRGR